MNFWWLSVFCWMAALAAWFQEILVLALAREEIEFAKWKVIVFTVIWIIIACSFFNAIFSPPVPIPSKFHMNVDELSENGRRKLFSEKCTELELLDARFCEKCRVLKPNRSHHCRTCDRCVMRMDHHCPILQVCVHHSNHKLYLLYLIWPCVLGIYVTIICAPYIVRIRGKMTLSGDELTREQLFITSAFLNAVTIALSLLYLLYGQFERLLRNRTVIEDSQLTDIAPEDKDYYFIVYDMGSRLANWRSIFGQDWRHWLLPTANTPGDGVTYPYTTIKGELLH